MAFAVLYELRRCVGAPVLNPQVEHPKPGEATLRDHGADLGVQWRRPHAYAFRTLCYSAKGEAYRSRTRQPSLCCLASGEDGDEVKPLRQAGGCRPLALRNGESCLLRVVVMPRSAAPSHGATLRSMPSSLVPRLDALRLRPGGALGRSRYAIFEGEAAFPPLARPRSGRALGSADQRGGRVVPWRSRLPWCRGR